MLIICAQWCSVERNLCYSISSDPSLLPVNANVIISVVSSNMDYDFIRKEFTPPAHLVNADASMPKKNKPINTVAPHMAGLRTDVEFETFMKDNKLNTVVVEFGSTWCQKCHEIFPSFYFLSKQFSGLKYAIAQVDYMKEASKGLKYTPTFVIYKNGRPVDEVVGKDPQRLADHLWMHSDDN